MIHFVTTAPIGERCSRCGRLRLAGVSEGVPYRLEPAPLTLLAELAARLAGRITYSLTAGNFIWRTPDRIAGDIRRGRPIVFADHTCATPATAADIDPTYLGVVARLIATVQSDADWSDVEMSALCRLGVQLGARVITDDTPPY